MVIMVSSDFNSRLEQDRWAPAVQSCAATRGIGGIEGLHAPAQTSQAQPLPKEAMIFCFSAAGGSPHLLV